MDLNQAYDKLLGHEGGYSNDAADPGGETYKGVSRKNNPTWPGWARIDAAKKATGFPASLDTDTVLDSLARGLYREKYWAPAQCDSLPAELRFQVFDTAVNSGVSQAIKLLQRAVCVTADGVIGPQTRMAIQAMPTARLNARFNAYRLALLASLPNWPRFGRGWALRIADNLLES